MNHKIKLTEPLTGDERVEIQLVCQALDEQRLEALDLASANASDFGMYEVAYRLQNAWDILTRILVADRELAGNSDNVVAFAPAE